MSDMPSPLRLTAQQRLNWIAEQCEYWKRYRESPQVAAPGSILDFDDAVLPECWPPLSVQTTASLRVQTSGT